MERVWWRLAAIDAIPIPSGPERQVSDELEKAVGKSTSIDRTSRLESLRRQDGGLEPIEADLLLGELLHPGPSEESKAWKSEYFHEVCLLLQRRKDGKEKFARVLATVAADTDRDHRIRDYAVQHLSTVWGSPDDGTGLRKSIEATFQMLLKDCPEVASSALLSLHLLGSDSSRGRLPQDGADHSFSIPNSKMIPAVQGVLNDSDLEHRRVPIRMAALRVISDRKIDSLLPEVRTMAANEEGEHAVTRMAAIAALAQFAEPQDRGLLESMNTADPRIAGAVKHALAQIQ